jgi:hypothetical protein
VPGARAFFSQNFVFAEESDMLDNNLKAQLQAYLERLQRPVELVASLDLATNGPRPPSRAG